MRQQAMRLTTACNKGDWQPVAASATLCAMDTNNPVRHDSADTQPRETEAAQRRRLAWEAEMIAEADADIAAGRLVDSAKVKTWIDTIGTDHELPVPYSGR